MEKLTATDASFLYSETPRCSSNVASVQLMQLPKGVSSNAFITSLKEYMSERLHLLDYLTRKPVFVPGNLDHPVWTRDDSFSIDNHIIPVPVPAPGNWAQAEDLIGEIHNIKMPMDRPLWALYVLTGLEDGKVAYYQQVHHSTIDGASGNAAYQVLMDETPDHPAIAQPDVEVAAEKITSLGLLEDAFHNFMRFQLGSASRLMGTTDSTRRLMQRALDPEKDFGALGKTVPETPFNTQVSEKRIWKTSQIPLAEVKRMGKTLEGTVNDIVMAICAGGLRRYLERHDQLPEESLIAGCPVSLRQPGDTKAGTQVTMMNVELGTHIADPIERIAVIRASAKTAKEVTDEMSGAFEADTSIPGLPSMMSSGINAVESFGLAQFFRGPINVVISNVPGPRNTLYSNGARMLTHYPVSIVAQGLALNITVQSYLDQIYLGITACAQAVPDADVLRDDMMATYAELKNRLFPENVSELKLKAAASTVIDTPINDENISPEQERVA